MFAEHYQFYLFDSAADPGEVSIYWDEESKEQMFLVTDEILGIGTVRHLDVPVELEIYASQPVEEPLEDFDQVAECSLQVPSGAIKISGATEDVYEAKRVELAPGTYGVRVYWGALTDVDEEGFEGEDFYKVSMWPTDEPPAYAVLKQWETGRRFLY
jgi:hypothetical protein